MCLTFLINTFWYTCVVYRLLLFADHASLTGHLIFPLYNRLQIFEVHVKTFSPLKTIVKMLKCALGIVSNILSMDVQLILCSIKLLLFQKHLNADRFKSIEI